MGHGIGRDLHEDPQVPNFRCFTMPDPVMEEGLVIAIEPMINAGTKRVVTARDEWTIVTADRACRPTSSTRWPSPPTGPGC